MVTSLGDAKLAVDKYRQRMRPEQYFRDGKQYFELDRARVTKTERLRRLLVGLLLGRCALLLAGLLRAPWRFPRRVCSWVRLGLRRLGMEYYPARRRRRSDGLGCPPHESGYA